MEQRKVNKRRRGRWMILGCLAILAAAVAVLAFWQRNNIRAVANFTKYTQEELEQKLQENDQVIQSAMSAAPEITVRPVTEEERQALREGTLSQEELAELLLAPREEAGASQEGGEPSSTLAAASGEGQPQETPEQTDSKPGDSPSSGTSAYEKELSALIAKVYVLREEYLIALDNMQAAATADYKAIPSEQRSGSAVASLVSDYLARAAELEKECDGRMDAIITQLEKLLKENGGDMSLADTVFNTYVDEKSLKKAWYMAELKKRGLI